MERNESQAFVQNPEMEDIYFQLQAQIDLTKHLGGREATDELIARCHIESDDEVLDVGCGVGITPSYLVREVGCRVVGIDIRPAMIERARARAGRDGLASRAEFRVADVRELPFADGIFDAVICESVIALVDEKARALDECVRVVKPGGYVGLTEATWMREPPRELLDYLHRAFGRYFETYDLHGWQKLLEAAALQDVVAQAHPITMRSEARDQIRRMGVGQVLRAWWRALKLLIRQPKYRRFYKEALSQPKDLVDYWGYGIYVGLRPVAPEGQ